VNPLLKQWWRGEPVTLLDKLGTVESHSELDGFAAQIARDGGMTAELLAAIERHRTKLG